QGGSETPARLRAKNESERLKDGFDVLRDHSVKRDHLVQKVFRVLSCAGSAAEPEKNQVWARIVPPHARASPANAQHFLKSLLGTGNAAAPQVRAADTATLGVLDGNSVAVRRGWGRLGGYLRVHARWPSGLFIGLSLPLRPIAPLPWRLDGAAIARPARY